MAKRSRIVPGVTLRGVSRGGGSEKIEWADHGPMHLVRAIVQVTPGYPINKSDAGLYAFIPTPTIPSGNNPPTDTQVRGMGDSAIKMSVPSSPSVNLLTSAGEITMDGLPGLPDFVRWRRTLRDLLPLGRDLSRDYVAYNFAWKPLVQEVRAYYGQVVRSDEIVRSANKAAGAGIISVGHSFPADTGSTAFSPDAIGGRWTDGATLGVIGAGANSTERSSRVWYEGKYLYFAPVPKDAAKASHDFSTKAKEVLGLQLTPEVLWNLSPWSWFADWLTNTDVVMSAISSTLSDGMVPVEGWVMHHNRRYAVTSVTGPRTGTAGGPLRFTPAATSNLFETKTRFPSLPFLGFGGAGGLTGRQISILAALGVGRA